MWGDRCISVIMLHTAVDSIILLKTMSIRIKGDLITNQYDHENKLQWDSLLYVSPKVRSVVSTYFKLASLYDHMYLNKAKLIWTIFV